MAFFCGAKKGFQKGFPRPFLPETLRRRAVSGVTGGVKWGGLSWGKRREQLLLKRMSFDDDFFGSLHGEM